MQLRSGRSLPAAFVMLAATSVIGMLLCLSVREKR